MREWRIACEKANDWDIESNKKLSAAIREEKAENKRLAKELSRKEKALAETAALLVLRKN